MAGAGLRRVKPLLYVYRVLLTGIHLMQRGEVEANLIHLNDRFRLPYIPELVERKLEGKGKIVLVDADLGLHQAEYARRRSFRRRSRPAICRRNPRHGQRSAICRCG
ncbi:MAG: nucleotidyltransferase domain-containing protein [Planctomycetota bacterium]|nr:nucleotidyltransferase domain-containing protein [Planctomycetota bacterium]